MSAPAIPSRNNLPRNIQAEVVIVGAGIAGLSAAYHLAREGKSVVVVDDGPPAGGETVRTTAHLSNAIDAGYSELERLHGEAGAKLAAASHSWAIDQLEKNSRSENIDCDFSRLEGFLFNPTDDSTTDLDKEYQAAQRAGAKVKKLPKVPLSFESGPCLEFAAQGQFHPIRYLAGLAEAIRRRDGQIYSGAHVVKVEGGDRASVYCQDGTLITADAAIVATNSPVIDRLSIHTKQAQYRTYAIGIPVPRDSIPSGLYWDTLDPYHYVRTQKLDERQDLLIVGGEDHKTGQIDEGALRVRNLERWAKQRFSLAEPVQYRWSGQIIETIDGLAFIGPNPGDKPNIFIATGDCGMGMTHGAIAGVLLTDLIFGRNNPWAELYDPSRKPLGAAGEFAKENLNTALQYTDWIKGGEVESEDEIKPSMGAVIRKGLKKIAVYRDSEGKLHRLSAVCTHLGCIVTWNSLEQTWDCPCHGSRFDPNGAPVNGPANQPLAKL